MNNIETKIIEFLIEYIIDNPPSYVMDNSPIPLEVFVNSQNERTRAYMDILETAIAHAQKILKTTKNEEQIYKEALYENI